MNDSLIKLETKRLQLVCVELEDMLLLNKGNNETIFEQKMGYSIGKLEGLEKGLCEEFCKLALDNYDSSLWFRLWDIVRVEDNIRIGGALFKGGPDPDGEVEIGYGIDDEFQCQGYATEAIQAMVQWALDQESVISVKAETDKDNTASQIVLQRVGMVNYSESDIHYLWRRRK